MVRFSATLVAIFCFAPRLHAEEPFQLDPSWTAPGSDDDDDGAAAPEAQNSAAPSGPTAAPPNAPLPAPPPAPFPDPPGAAAPSASAGPDWARMKLYGRDPELKFQVYSLAKGANKKDPILACANPCRVLLPRGEYRVRVSGGPEHVEGDRELELTADTAFHFSLPDRSARTAGLTLGITGSALVPIGLLLAFSASMGHCDYTCDEDAQTAAYVGLGMMAAGAVLTPVGWVLFARNRKPRVEHQPFGGTNEGARPARFGIGAAPIAGGAAAGFWGSF